MKEQNQREKRWPGRRAAVKIDRGATNDVEELIQLINGMARALISLFKPRQRRSSRPTQPTDQDEQPETPEKNEGT